MSQYGLNPAHSDYEPVLQELLAFSATLVCLKGQGFYGHERGLTTRPWRNVGCVPSLTRAIHALASLVSIAKRNLSLSHS